jgi:hypothetical protein
MSTHLSPRGRVVLVAGVVAGLVAVPAGAALADPPGIDPPSCEQTLLKVNLWPGTIDTASGRVTVFSDGYDSYLSRSPECVAGP